MDSISLTQSLINAIPLVFKCFFVRVFLISKSMISQSFIINGDLFSFFEFVQLALSQISPRIIDIFIIWKISPIIVIYFASHISKRFSFITNSLQVSSNFPAQSSNRISLQIRKISSIFIGFVSSLIGNVQRSWVCWVSVCISINTKVCFWNRQFTGLLPLRELEVIKESILGNIFFDNGLGFDVQNSLFHQRINFPVVLPWRLVLSLSHSKEWMIDQWEACVLLFHLLLVISPIESFTSSVTLISFIDLRSPKERFLMIISLNGRDIC